MILAWNGRAYAAIGEENANVRAGLRRGVPRLRRGRRPQGREGPGAGDEARRLHDGPAAPGQADDADPVRPAHTEAELTGLPPKLEEFLPETNPKLKQATIVQDQQWWAENADAISERWQETFQG